MRATQCNSIHIDRALLARSFQISPVLQKQPHYRLVPFHDGPHQSGASCPAEHIRACILHDGRILLSSNRTPYSSAAFTSAPYSRSSRTIDSLPSTTEEYSSRECSNSSLKTIMIFKGDAFWHCASANEPIQSLASAQSPVAYSIGR